MENKKRLIIIDGNSIIHRAYHALPPLTTKNGEIVGAVYGFLLFFLRSVKEFQPDFIVACFDFPAPTFRHEKYKTYKSKRPPTPKDLIQQISKIKEVLKNFNVAVFEKKGFEADDLIGTIARLVPKKQILPKIETIILSGDSDVLQLIDDWTSAYILKKGIKDTILYKVETVQEKYQGLLPTQLLDFKALRGDPSDNIPGVTGVGEKTAINLILKFNNLENLYQEIEKGVSGQWSKKISQKLKDLLLRYKEQAFISKFLAQIDKNVEIDFNLKNYDWHDGYNKVKAVETLKELEFFSLIKRLDELDGQAKKIEKNLRLW